MSVLATYQLSSFVLRDFPSAFTLVPRCRAIWEQCYGNRSADEPDDNVNSVNAPQADVDNNFDSSNATQADELGGSSPLTVSASSYFGPTGNGNPHCSIKKLTDHPTQRHILLKRCMILAIRSINQMQHRNAARRRRMLHGRSKQGNMRTAPRYPLVLKTSFTKYLYYTPSARPLLTCLSYKMNNMYKDGKRVDPRSYVHIPVESIRCVELSLS